METIDHGRLVQDDQIPERGRNDPKLIEHESMVETEHLKTRGSLDDESQVFDREKNA